MNCRCTEKVKWIFVKVCVKCSLPILLDSSNFVETLCDSWVLSTSVWGTGSFSAHTVTHSTSESAHETQSVSTKLQKTKKCQRTLDTNLDKYSLYLFSAAAIHRKQLFLLNFAQKVALPPPLKKTFQTTNFFTSVIGSLLGRGRNLSKKRVAFCERFR